MISLTFSKCVQNGCFREDSESYSSYGVGTSRNSHPVWEKDRLLGKTKFYAVRRGFRPGIYYSWETCEPQVKFFSGAQFKSFRSYDEAIRFFG